MKDFNNPAQILTFLDDINTAASDALAEIDMKAFQSVIHDLAEAEIYKTQLGQDVIAYNNMFGASAPYNDFFANYAFSKVKDNAFFLSNDNFRKTVNRIRDIKESCLMFMIEAKHFSDSEQSILDAYSYQDDPDAEEIPQKGMSINKEMEAARKSTQKSDKNLFRRLTKAQLKYLSKIEDTLYHTPMEYAPAKKNNSEDSDKIPYIGLDDKITYENKAYEFIQPIMELAKERRKYILTYQQDIDTVINDFDQNISLSDVLEQVNQYLADPYLSIDEHRPFFYFNTLSVDKESKDEKFSLGQYLCSTGNYGKNRLSAWTRGRHQTYEYTNWKRETALRTFLYLGIPATGVDAFFRLYGMCFGTSTDTFTVTLENGDEMFLPEAYIRNLIHFGLSYDIINYLIPKRIS